MYLFQPCKVLRRYMRWWNLHSTMYLFQPITGSNREITAFIYIPLCIYFNTLWQQTPLFSSKFTFHYVSISTGLILNTTPPEFNLHSTMYLFQHISTTHMIAGAIIYIPLCIYFNWLCWKWKILYVKIYIPLCIYFNQ